MASKKEMIEKLVASGYEEEVLKNKKNAELEDLLKQEADQAKQGTTDTGEPEAEAEEEQNGGQPQENASEQTEEDGSESEKPDDQADSGVEAEQVLRETVHQLSIFTDYIYNVKHKGASIVVDNLGYGDVYLDTVDLAKVGSSRRLKFKESVRLEGVSQVYFVSASQPVIQILEIN